MDGQEGGGPGRAASGPLLHGRKGSDATEEGWHRETWGQWGRVWTVGLKALHTPSPMPPPAK